MTERRKNALLMDYIVPIIASVASAVFTGYLTLQVALTQIETQLIYVETDITDLKNIVKAVAQNQIILGERGVWIAHTEKRIDALESLVKTLPSERDYKALERRLDPVQNR